jgi:hypothetical protein
MPSKVKSALRSGDLKGRGKAMADRMGVFWCDVRGKAGVSRVGGRRSKMGHETAADGLGELLAHDAAEVLTAPCGAARFARRVRDGM